MKQTAKGKIVVLAVSFAVFIGGVMALSLDRGPLRCVLLVCCVAVLLGIAARQTLVRLRKDK